MNQYLIQEKGDTHTQHMNMKKIALFGGSFNPPGIHHKIIAEELVKKFDEVFIVPCGSRKDKVIIQEDAIHRIELMKRAFHGVSVTFDFSDLESQVFTPTISLDKKYTSHGSVWHVIGSDLLVCGEDGRCLIQDWVGGEEFFQNGKFAVLLREGYPITEKDLPPNSIILGAIKSGSSMEIRRRIREGVSLGDVTSPSVEEYIRMHNLYM